MDINQIFVSLKMDAVCISDITGDNSHFYEIKLGPELTLNKFRAAVGELNFRLGSEHPPFLEVIPSSGVVRLQVIKSLPDDIDLITSSQRGLVSRSDFYLGKSYLGKPVAINMLENSNVLLAGTTGSGKSVALHTIIANSLLKNEPVEIFLGDSKLVEFKSYDHLPQVSCVAQSYLDHLAMLDTVQSIMENRFEMLQQAKLTHAEKIPALPRILVVIDEIADLIVQDRNHDWEFQTKMIAIAQKCRAAGISLVIATQRPSVNIISGIIKANFPTRIACRVSSKADSRVILDAPGAESLLGRGDAIIDSRENSKVRFKFAATSIANLFEYLRLPVPDLKG